MKRSNRRQFLVDVGTGLGVAGIADAKAVLPEAGHSASSLRHNKSLVSGLNNLPAEIDFRYSPLSSQLAYCFPDDRYKSLVGEHGDLRYGHPGRGRGIDYFPEVVEFTLEGMEANRVRWQLLEAPGVPIVHTRIDRPEAFLELTTFATRREGEGRVDNVILEVKPRTLHSLHAVPIITVRSRHDIAVTKTPTATILQLESETATPFMVSNAPLSLHLDGFVWRSYALNAAVAEEGKPFRCIFRFPQEGQDAEKLRIGLGDPDGLLTEARQCWQSWKPSEGNVSWELPSRYGEFLVACARNIQQAREKKSGKVTFQVGPTVYRGLWIVDGNFILEAARYLGYDKAAQEGLETEWARQLPDGQIVAGGGREHWKDTGIAMFTLVRQAELSQDWSYFRQMQPNVLRAVKFLAGLRDKARSGGTVNGRYSLLAPGFGDGGLGGIRPEFTNTIWVLAGLKAVTEVADRLQLSGFDDARRLYRELRTSFFAAAAQEMRQHPDGFRYLPMLMKEDPAWSAPDSWDRPQPQIAQWALSHAIYPGLVFEKDDPIVAGHIRLMQACTQEDVPAETGWLHHGGLWNYNAPFVSHVYLWAGLADWARQTFIGFLNHATPRYCWREEQPLHGSLTASYVGDMPHNWASAECVLYLRHMLALEDGQALRLLAGIGEADLATGQPIILTHTPTRFGRVGLELEPLDGRKGWRLKFRRDSGPAPTRVQLPATLGRRFSFSGATGAATQREKNVILLAPGATSWEAVWKAAS
jgi:hypothetical protein